MASYDRTPAKTARARALRRAMTDSEKTLWSRLRADRLGVSFRRQHPVGPYVLDFYAPMARLAVELDGGQHGTETGIAKDAARTAWLAARGIRVLRFWNNQVFENIDGVLLTIHAETQALLAASTPTPTLPLPGGGSSGVIAALSEDA
jgi:very-short-patch-repair endonuclease